MLQKKSLSEGKNILVILLLWRYMAQLHSVAGTQEAELLGSHVFVDFFQVYTSPANNSIIHTFWFAVGEKFNSLNSKHLLHLRLLLIRSRVKEPRAVFPQKASKQAVDVKGLVTVAVLLIPVVFQMDTLNTLRACFLNRNAALIWDQQHRGKKKFY